VWGVGAGGGWAGGGGPAAQKTPPPAGNERLAHPVLNYISKERCPPPHEEEAGTAFA